MIEDHELLQANSIEADSTAQKADASENSLRAGQRQEKEGLTNGTAILGDLLRNKKAKKSNKSAGSGEEKIVSRAAERTAAAVGKLISFSPCTAHSQFWQANFALYLCISFVSRLHKSLLQILREALFSKFPEAEMQASIRLQITFKTDLAYLMATCKEV